ncbi:DNA mismatch repair protein MutS [Thermosipho ferrireducens]|uniref:DNA mismatch repair protein MutS n=1 Tax=Thermosipho ferrireducens TaxID=2571116 RepID=A0ABX7S4D7_9BACT|nr:DNA mismatch repair protein MutS [Thermosipho ferrireducens]QTA37297.1 DNA mismatch repair protein MutS [Thermosipho ferrireducens]
MSKLDIFESAGIDFIIKNLDISSPITQRYIRSKKFKSVIKSQKKIQKHLNAISKVLDAEEKYIQNIKLSLSHLPDIHTTIERLINKNILDEIELFEIKVFSIYIQEITITLRRAKLYRTFPFPDLEKVIEILDPEGLRIPTFYIYSAYSKELLEIRKKKDITNDEKELTEILQREKELESQICHKLSAELEKYAINLLKSYNLVIFLDLTIAKSFLTKKLNLTKPEFSKDNSIYLEKLFNPEISENLKKLNLKFQPINITLKPGVQAITGANMGGKTVLLKTIALCQLLFQMGFFVPAQKAILPLYDEITLLSGDFQSISSGLSSYASEMIIINSIYKKLKKGKVMLVLLDEPARTTNPTEGKAIVSALLNLFSKNNSCTVITTHFDGAIPENVRHLRVKGLKELNKKITLKTIQKYFDYSIEEVNNNENIPKEAIKIARILGIDKDIIKEAEEVLRYEK